MDACTRETLRVFPSVPFMTRQHGVVEGVDVMLMPCAIQKDERHWKNPHEFTPERFLDSSIKRHAYAWIPFSAGYRNCIGQRFAMMEMKIQMGYLFKFFNFESVHKREDLGVEANLVIRPNKGVNVRLTARDTQE